ncbi:unnamed protein product [Trichobilharzia szidati]|nr:unnamed protein product [Trichobilharzia szidati]
MDDDSSPYHTTGPFSDTSFEDISSEHSSDSSLDWDYNGSLLKPESAEGSTHSPEATTSYAEISGFYGQEEIKQKLESINYSPQKRLPLSDYYMSLDSSSDEPEHKPQPFLHYYNDDSSSDDEKSEEEVMKSVKPSFNRNENFNTKSFNKGHVQQSSLSSVARKKTMLAKLSRRTPVQPAENTNVWQVGELVWARSLPPDNFPWWPAIVVAKPKKYSVSETIPATYRVCLLGLIRPLTFLTLPKTRLRLYAGREEYESFYRKTVMEAKNKLRALRQFAIPPSLQEAWFRAREAAAEAKLAKPRPAGRLALFPWITDPAFLKLDPLADYVRKNTGKYTLFGKSRKRTYSEDSSSSSEDSEKSPASDSDADSKGKHGPGPHASSSTTSGSSFGPRKPLKPSNDDSKNDRKTGLRWIDLANSFEFEKLRFGYTTPKHYFLCCVCGEYHPAWSAGNNNATTTTNSSSQSNPRNTVGLQPLTPDMNTGFDSQKTCSQSTQSDRVENTVVMPCAGGCGNYLHLYCAPHIFYRIIKHKICENNGTDDGGGCGGGKDIPMTNAGYTESSVQPNPVCSLCLAGLRQCFICYLTHPDPSLTHLQTSNGNSEPPVVVDKGISEITIKMEEDTTTAAATPTETAYHHHHQKDIQPVLESNKSDHQLIRCSVRSCRRWFHPSCLRKPPFAIVVRERRTGAFSCPAHTCLACTAETPGTMPRPSAHFIRCVMCPAAYHPGEWCLPAGSKEVAPNLIICPRHSLEDECKLYCAPPNIQLELPPAALLKMFKPTNVSWCFICSKGGRIICCESCPASFHEECLKIDEVPDKFICEDCTNGRMLRYGEIVWARLPPSLQSYHQRCLKLSVAYNSHRLPGVFRPNEYASLTSGMYWWPGELVHPQHLPTSQHSVKDDSHNNNSQTFAINFQPTSSPKLPTSNNILGSVFVRLYGLTNSLSTKHPRPVYLLTTRARLFPYEEGDDKRRGSSSSSSDDDDDESTESGRGEESDIVKKKVSSSSKQRANRNRRKKQDDGEDEDPLLELNPSNFLVEDSTNHTGNTTTTTTSNNNNNNINKTPESGNTSLESSNTTTSANKLTTYNHNNRSPRYPYLRPRRNRYLNDENSSNCNTGLLSNRRTPPYVIRRRKFIYNAAIKQAARGWLKRREKFSKLLGRKRRPDYYKPIKVNWPIGSVRVYRLTDSSEAPRCDCIKDSEDPCGPSSNCINRELHYECLPSACPNGEACRNQRFTKRLYPPQQPFWTGDERGWGLKTMVAIRAGEFVNEYIGDLIDEDEANRRLRFAHENNITNYYMMKLDSQRIIDAGPKGNLSRFMNHSCDPNLSTQKWTVNGDNRIGLFAIRNIAAGEELTFNYNFVALGQERLNCRCGASNCVGFLGARSESSNNNNNGNIAQVGPTTTNNNSSNGTSANSCSESNSSSTVPVNADTIRGSRRNTSQGGSSGNSRAGGTEKVHTNHDGRDSISSKTSISTVSNHSMASGRNSSGSVMNTSACKDKCVETKCFRCGKVEAPVGNRSLQSCELSNSIYPSITTTMPTNTISSSNKRGLKRELKRIVAAVIHHQSPIKHKQSRLSAGSSLKSSNMMKTIKAEDHDDENDADNDDDGRDGDDKQKLKKSSPSSSDLIMCSKSDCPKVYHLFCLDLDAPPVSGRWFCPWHHCDACGRPSHVFCSICPSSFCLAHVEGSIIVLPPIIPKRKSRTSNNRSNNNSNSSAENVLLARIVCMSHYKLVEKMSKTTTANHHGISSVNTPALPPLPPPSPSPPPPPPLHSHPSTSC